MKSISEVLEAAGEPARAVATNTGSLSGLGKLDMPAQRHWKAGADDAPPALQAPSPATQAAFEAVAKAVAEDAEPTEARELPEPSTKELGPWYVWPYGDAEPIHNEHESYEDARYGASRYLRTHPSASVRIIKVVASGFLTPDFVSN